MPRTNAKTSAKSASTKSASSKSASTKGARNKKTTPAPAPAVAEPAPEPVVAESNPLKEHLETLGTGFDNIIERLNVFKNEIQALLKDYRQQKKDVEKALKTVSKRSKKRRTGGNAKSGLNMPTGITGDLASFLGEDESLRISRTDVTRRVIAYIKEHELQDAEKRRVILPDDNLGALLNVPEDVELTYFNLQTYLAPHFVKDD